MTVGRIDIDEIERSDDGGDVASMVGLLVGIWRFVAIDFDIVVIIAQLWRRAVATREVCQVQ